MLTLGAKSIADDDVPTEFSWRLAIELSGMFMTLRNLSCKNALITAR